jgi:hypothetical protein
MGMFRNQASYIKIKDIPIDLNSLVIADLNIFGYPPVSSDSNILSVSLIILLERKPPFNEALAEGTFDLQYSNTYRQLNCSLDSLLENRQERVSDPPQSEARAWPKPVITSYFTEDSLRPFSYLSLCQTFHTSRLDKDKAHLTIFRSTHR